MRGTMRIWAESFGRRLGHGRIAAFAAAVLLAAACHSEQVLPAPSCSDPCCGGNAEFVDCGQHPTLACPRANDSCTAQEYGCMGGMFYSRTAANLPAACLVAEAGLVTGEGGGSFGGGDDAALEASSDDAAGALADGAADALPGVSNDAASDALADSGLDAATDSGLDAATDAP
jgi:hypothetical protein